MSTRSESPELVLEGAIPGAPASEAKVFRSRVLSLMSELVHRHPDVRPFSLRMAYGRPPTRAVAAEPEELPSPGGEQAPGRSQQYPTPTFTGIDPRFSFDQLVLPSTTRERLLDCISFVEVAPIVFDQWGLRRIEPRPSTAVNFRGPPGTGKTMAGHAAAHLLKRKLILSRLSELESKYHGQGPKNLVGLFESAMAENAVLFIDEAESLLSRRFAQPEQAAESAINSMRTELLMALDSFDGLVIFASNLPHSYDAAVESRLVHVDFELPDRSTRCEIWRAHLPATLPLASDVDVERLAETEDVSGRDIKLAVISAAVSAARRSLREVSLEMLLAALDQQRANQLTRPSVRDDGLRPEEGTESGDRIVKAVARHRSH